MTFPEVRSVLQESTGTNVLCTLSGTQTLVGWLQTQGHVLPPAGSAWGHSPEVLGSAWGCWAPIGAGCSPCVLMGAAGCSPCVPMGAGWIPWAPMGAGWIPWAPMGAGWMPCMCRAWEASTVISCMGLRCTVEATPTPVWAVMAELGAWADTASSNRDTSSLLARVAAVPPHPFAPVFTLKDYFSFKKINNLPTCLKQ